MGSEKRALALSAALLILSSVVFGVRLPLEMGSDFGVYFAGSKSLAENASLYTEHLDHKGPLLYALTLLFQSLFGYSIQGATLSLVSLFFVSGLLAVLAASMRRTAGPKTSLLIVACWTASSIFQGSNSIPSYLVASLVITAAFAASRSLEGNRKVFFVATSVLAASLATLVRIDGAYAFVFAAIAIYRLDSNKRVKAVSVSWILPLALLLSLASLFSFTVADFFEANVTFNIAYAQELPNSIPSFFYIMFLGVVSGIFPILTVITIKRVNSQIHSNLIETTMLALPVLLFFLIGSFKDYHLLIMLPSFVLATLLLFERTAPFRTSQATSSLYFSIFSTFALLANVVAPTGVLPQESKVELMHQVVSHSQALEGEHHFAFNQGWPYIIQKKTPEMPFTIEFFLTSNIDTETWDLGESSIDSHRYLWISGPVFRRSEEFFGNHYAFFDDLGPFVILKKRPTGNNVMHRHE